MTPKEEGDALGGMPRHAVQRLIVRTRHDLRRAERMLAAIKSRDVFYRVAERHVRMKRAAYEALLPFQAEVDA